MIGNRIGGRYEILKGIGDGGMSKVYLAHDIILNRDVAIKVLNYDFANEDELKRRFKREALSATSLTHPNIVDIFDVGEEGELHYLVMEYVEGQTLKKFIQSNGPLRPEEAVPIMRQLVSAISNAHHNGIIHRDIKPQNILMDADGNVKITDFGIAMALSATVHTKTNSVIGTVHYLSPEQARGGMATKKSDIYSLGIVFYELLTGELPFSAETAVAIALKHLQEETPSVKELFPDIPQSVENVILKATAKDAAYRYQSADEMYDDLLTVLSPERLNEEKFTIPFDDEKTMAIPAIREAEKFENVEETKKIDPVATTTDPDPPSKKKKRKKWPILLGLVVVIALVVLFLWMSGFLGPKQKEIPDVENLEVSEAEALLTKEGFKVEGQEEEPSDMIEEGRVIRTIPEAGEKQDVGTAIMLIVSTGEETTVMSDYTGKGYTQIANLLAGYDFKSITANEVFSDEPPGTIIGQDPPAETEVIPGDTDLVFTVSKGIEKKAVADLKGFSESQLTDYAKSSGFEIKIVGEQHSNSVPAGHVISQKPQSPTELAKGGKIEVVLSQGPVKKPVKHIIQTVTIEYAPPATGHEDSENGEYGEEQERVPQTIRIYIQDRKHSLTDPVEEFPITETTTRRITIELEEGQVGAYRIMRDSEEIAQQKFTYEDAQ
ncbi:Stk1 family PASTA domain-containing Ser/Thr kinase [Sporosarcina sp. 179-K 3D1 HS]|uniref:Stk1 family PASTA domain-containing Ser/Thr kinase n=1 Tax=Sporosarcina sp. 179-K 3D1 HS TaxID=3232169 RepID=UPI0039A01722